MARILTSSLLTARMSQPLAEHVEAPQDRAKKAIHIFLLREDESTLHVKLITTETTDRVRQQLGL